MSVSRPRFGAGIATLGLLAALTPSLACASTPGTSTNPTGSTASSSPTAAGPSTTTPAATIPRPDHVIVVVFENKQEGSIIGNPDAPYINSLANGGANMTQSYAITHPSQPNYLALFSGSTQGVTDDSCPHTFTANSQANEMLKKGFTFVSYAEGLPSQGSLVCTSGKYARKHAPWTNFKNVPAVDQQPFTSFPSDYTQLPDVSWVIPDLCDDMHDCPIATGDSWLQNNLGLYASWALDHNSLLIVTFDEDDSQGPNKVATIFYGQPVKVGAYSEHITHYTVLRTMEAMFGVAALGNAKSVKPIKDIWQS